MSRRRGTGLGVSGRGRIYNGYADAGISHPVGSIWPTPERFAGRAEDGGGGGDGAGREVLGMERGAGTAIRVGVLRVWV